MKCLYFGKSFAFLHLLLEHNQLAEPDEDTTYLPFYSTFSFRGRHNEHKCQEFVRPLGDHSIESEDIHASGR